MGFCSIPNRIVSGEEKLEDNRKKAVERTNKRKGILILTTADKHGMVNNIAWEKFPKN